MSATISVVINTLDEEGRIAWALRSVRAWADDLVVVDMESTDRTAAIAGSLGARVLTHPRIGFVEPARAFACAQANGDWILVLDADELVPEPLSRTLRRIADRDEADVVRLPLVNHLLGAPLLHSGWNPERDRHVRFWKRDAVTLPDAIHGAIAPRAGMRLLDLPYADGEAIVHLSHVDVATFVDKLNRYTGVEARQAAERGERPHAGRALRAAVREWLARYLWHGGYRDGWRGLSLTLLMAAYRITAYAKLAELDEASRLGAASRRYADSAERLLAAYDEPRAQGDAARAGRGGDDVPAPARGGTEGDGTL